MMTQQITGLYLSSIPNPSGNEKFITRLYFSVDKGVSRTTVWFRETENRATSIFISLNDGKLFVILMKEDQALDENPIIWESNDFELNQNFELTRLKRKNNLVKVPVLVRETSADEIHSLHVNASSASEDVSPLNDPQSDGSATLASEVVSDKCCATVVASRKYEPNSISNVLPKRVISSMINAHLLDVPHPEEAGHHESSPPQSIDVKSSQPFEEKMVQDVPQCVPSPLKQETGPVQVTEFSGKDATFRVSEDKNSITYQTKSGEIVPMSLGIVKNMIKTIEVEMVYFGIFLILIHGTDGLVYVSGYSNQRTAKSLTPVCANPCFSSSSARETFKVIEFFPPKTDDDGSELRTLDFKLVFSKSVKKFNIDSEGKLQKIPNF
jgi:hypothetical protein